ncbi:UNVERIFIED_CONTAM: hypothetical protein GTU68_050647 [Idotea baltica]|nr:hypothetical protein [Idotea baltica]
MGQDLYNTSSEAKEIFKKADGLLGYSLSSIMFGGTEDELKATKVTQPALYVHSMAALTAHEGVRAVDYMVGHSLGECTAMAAAGVLSFEDGLRLVDHRARAMQAGCDDQPSTMAAIVGLDDHEVAKICASIDDTVVAANYNCPGQLVISGSVPGVHTAVELLKEAGAKRAIVLNVAGAFHSPLMQSAKEDFAAFVQTLEFSKPSCPIVQNVTATAVSDPTQLKANLIEQLTSPVRWTESMLFLAAQGVQSAIEVGGNGKVLKGLMRRIDRSVDVTAIL